MPRRAHPNPKAASNEGVRLLCVLVRFKGCARLARIVALTEAAIRHYTNERRRPDPEAREAMAAELGIPEASWFSAPTRDAEASDADALALAATRAAWDALQTQIRMRMRERNDPASSAHRREATEEDAPATTAPPEMERKPSQ